MKDLSFAEIEESGLDCIKHQIICEYPVGCEQCGVPLEGKLSYYVVTPGKGVYYCESCGGKHYARVILPTDSWSLAIALRIKVEQNRKLICELEHCYVAIDTFLDEQSKTKKELT